MTQHGIEAYASGGTVAVFNKMNGITTNSSQEIGGFTFAPRTKVGDGQFVLRHGFEDCIAVRQDYHSCQASASRADPPEDDR